eukprot:1022956-Amphidinium_carterae.1
MQVCRRFGMLASSTWRVLHHAYEAVYQRFSAMLSALLKVELKDPLDVCIEQWECDISVYEQQSLERLADNIKLALLQSLTLNAGRLATYEDARKRQRSYSHGHWWSATTCWQGRDVSKLTGNGKMLSAMSAARQVTCLLCADKRSRKENLKEERDPPHPRRKVKERARKN